MAKYRVTYSRANGKIRLPVEIEASSESAAIMRAGMKRAHMLQLEEGFFQGWLHNKKAPLSYRFRPEKWTRESVEVIDEG